MNTQRRWSTEMCFYCRLLDIRALAGGRVVYWCGKRNAPVKDSIIWKRNCRGFLPVRPPEPVAAKCGACPMGRAEKTRAKGLPADIPDSP